MIRERVDQLRDWFERLSQRERTMVSALGVAFVLTVVLIIGFLITDGLTSLEERNADMRQALKDIDTQRDSYIKARFKGQEIDRRIGGQPVALQGYLEQAAKDTGVEIPESNERPPQPAGKAYVERAVDIRLKAVRIEQLGAFLKRIETGPNLVLVTALSIHTRDDKHQDLDVEMTVSTYEKAPKKAEPKKGDKT